MGLERLCCAAKPLMEPLGATCMWTLLGWLGTGARAGSDLDRFRRAAVDTALVAEAKEAAADAVLDTSVHPSGGPVETSDPAGPVSKEAEVTPAKRKAAAGEEKEAPAENGEPAAGKEDAAQADPAAPAPAVEAEPAKKKGGKKQKTAVPGPTPTRRSTRATRTTVEPEP